MQTVRPPIVLAPPSPRSAQESSRDSWWLRLAWWPSFALAVGVGLFALLVRWPHLWTVPRFTDETLEVLHSLAIVRDGARPLTNYDTYYGALYNYLVAAALWLGGESPFVPRLVVLLIGALTVAATYLLGHEFGLRVDLHSRLVPRAVGTLAALLLATNGAHVVVNSHVAWSNCLTPLFTTLAFWALLRATRRPRSSPSGPALALAGLLFGLALQTHPLVAALLPGAAAYVLWRAADLRRTPWPYLGLALFGIGYANVLVHNWDTGFESIRSAQRIRGEYAQDQQASVGYLSTLGAMLLLLARVLGGAIDQRGDPAAYLADPVVVLACTLAVVAVAWLARRGEPLPLLLALGFLVLLPQLNPKFRTLITSRYLMPIVPLLFAATAAAVVHGPGGLVSRSALPTPARRRVIQVAAAIAAAVLVIAPLASLERYYGRAFERSDTNERILRLSAEIVAARRPDEFVLLDEAIGSELPDTGVTELRGLEYLLQFARVPHRAVRISPARLQDELRGGGALAVLNARDAADAASRLSVEPLDPRPAPSTQRRTEYRLYRLGTQTGRPRA